MAKWFEDAGVNSDIVLSTRIRFARNLKGIAYPKKMSQEDAKKVIFLVEEALEEMNYTFTKYDMQSLSPNEKEKLVEERYISPDFASSKIPSCVYISDDNNVSIMVNEEDHIRIQCIYAGLEDKKAYDLISKIDTYLSEKLDYAIHEKYGHLTSCLTNVGTGMRISYMVHIPAIVMFRASEGIFSAISKLGLTVRGMYGEGTKSAGHLFQISNQVTLGKDENEIIDDITHVVESIIAKEKELRQELLNQKGLVLEDKIMRSFGLLKNARIMQSKEMMNLLSDVRLGLSLGLIEDISLKELTRIMIMASKAHISSSDSGDAPFERDVERARYIRNTL